MFTPFQRFADYFGAHAAQHRDAHERDRAWQRALIALALGSVSAWPQAGAGVPDLPTLVLPLLCVAYAAVALLYRKFVLSRPGAGVISQYVFIVFDSVLTVVSLAGAPAALAGFYPVLMVQIVRCGMRFGLRTLWLSWGAGALAAAVLLPASEFWRAEPQLLRSFVIMMLVVPVLFAPLVRSLHRANEDLRAAAGTDPLTGLGNRRMLAEHLRLAQARSARDGTMLALVLFDLDNFKHVNDSRGHAVGDQLLVRVAEALRGHCRAGDFLARVGGDEFVLLLEGLPLLAGRERAQAVATKLVGVVRDAAEGFVPGAGVSASAGVHTWAHMTDAQVNGTELIERADRAMYEAKRAGKARVAMAVA